MVHEQHHFPRRKSDPVKKSALPIRDRETTTSSFPCISNNVSAGCNAKYFGLLGRCTGLRILDKQHHLAELYGRGEIEHYCHRFPKKFEIAEKYV